MSLHILPQWKYREQYERAKDKFTSILDTPEYEAHKRSKKITDVSPESFFSLNYVLPFFHAISFPIIFLVSA